MTDQPEPNHSRHIVFAGGGSGGHLTPAIAIAEALLTFDPHAQLTFLTSGRDIDGIVLRNSFVANDKRCTIIRLPMTQPPRINRSGPSHTWILWKSILRCCRVLKQRPAAAMLSTGAFASVPGLLAAKCLRIPVVLFEANVVHGKVNQRWARHAVLRLGGWPTKNSPTDSDFRYVGMPVRSVVPARTNSQSVTQESKVQQILIVGGSQGSHRLNDIVRAALGKMSLSEHWKILHQTGSNDASYIQPNCGRCNISTIPYIDDLPQALSRSEFAISRAGAVTLGEIAATGCPSILVPLSVSAENHQQKNALQFVKCGAAVLVDESSPQAVDDMVSAINQLIRDVEIREAMSEAARSLHQPRASDRIAKLLIEVADRTQGDD